MRRSILFLTAHDFRSPRKASLHFLAQEMAHSERVRFFSLRYSLLSKVRPDGRHPIAHHSDKLETVNGVECYLWKTFVHPFNMHFLFLYPLEALAYKLYVLCAPRLLKKWIREADIVFFESGTAAVFFDLAKRLNPSARMVYLTSDTLSSIRAARSVKNAVRRASLHFDHVCLPSKKMTEDFAPGSRFIFVPHGMDLTLANAADPSPYASGINAVSIGSMLFDASFFDIAARRFPNMTFHVIGCGRQRPKSWPSNVLHYGEMPYEKTLAYIKHADVALAPYRHDDIPPSLADTSMKLFQYAFFGVASVCPFEVAADNPRRFGYKSGDEASIASAIEAALAAGRAERTTVLTWRHIAARLLDPASFPDTIL